MLNYNPNRVSYEIMKYYSVLLVTCPSKTLTLYRNTELLYVFARYVYSIKKGHCAWSIQALIKLIIQSSTE